MSEKYGIGTKHNTREGYEIEVVEKLENGKRKIIFESGYEDVANITHINTGRIKNPYHPSVCEVGYLGLGEYKCSVNRKATTKHSTWNSMLQRCYDDKTQERHPTYKGITVCEEWYNFQNFARWHDENYPKIKDIKFHLDKDLLQQDVENKIYSPETCIFLPNNINLFLANKMLNNTSGFIGVSWDKTNVKWRAEIRLFGKSGHKRLGRFSTPELASKAYQLARFEQAEKAKEYLRSLNYLPEHIIQLIK